MARYIPKDPILWKIFDIPFALGCILLACWGIVFLPFIPLVLWRQRYLKEWFAKQLTKQGRIINWNSFLETTSKESGSVVVEVGNKRESRFWWMSDNILLQAPMAPPKTDELGVISYGGSDYHPFARWCYENYLEPDDGKAILVWPVEADFETFPFGEDYAEKMQQRFPKQSVVVLTFYDARYA